MTSFTCKSVLPFFSGTQVEIPKDENENIQSLVFRFVQWYIFSYLIDLFNSLRVYESYQALGVHVSGNDEKSTQTSLNESL